MYEAEITREECTFRNLDGSIDGLQRCQIYLGSIRQGNSIGTSASMNGRRIKDDSVALLRSLHIQPWLYCVHRLSIVSVRTNHGSSSAKNQRSICLFAQGVWSVMVMMMNNTRELCCNHLFFVFSLEVSIRIVYCSVHFISLHLLKFLTRLNRSHSLSNESTQTYNVQCTIHTTHTG